MTQHVEIHTGPIPSAIQSLQDYFEEGGTTVVHAAFKNTYFIHPDAVREQTPFYPDRARRSEEHYPKLRKGDNAVWPGDGRTVTLDDNSRAQLSWKRYTGRPLARRSGYGVRHPWGNPHNPDAFTAGFNLCYMPFWAGMLTEDQHPDPVLQKAICQASWNLYFADNPVCKPPDFVKDPGFDLDSVLGGNPLLILSRG